jgi:hypothetical protein
MQQKHTMGHSATEYGWTGLTGETYYVFGTTKVGTHSTQTANTQLKEPIEGA